MIENDHLGDWNPEKYLWLPTTVLLRTSIPQMIFFNQGIIILFLKDAGSARRLTTRAKLRPHPHDFIIIIVIVKERICTGSLARLQSPARALDSGIVSFNFREYSHR